MPRLVLPLLLSSALLAAHLPAQPPVRARVRGEVLDSIRQKPLTGATVQLVAADTPGRILAAVSNLQGIFQFDDVPAGVYLAGFLHPVLDTLGVESNLFRVEVSTTETITIGLGTPSAGTLIEARCGAPSAELPRGMFFGTVRQTNGTPLTGPARVRAQYNTNRIVDKRLERVPNVRIASSNAEGTVAVCGVPPNGTIIVRGFAGSDSSGFAELAVPRHGLLLRDLYIGPATRVAAKSSRTSSTLTGAASVRGVARNQTGQPITGARVTVWGTGVEVASNAAGQYQIVAMPEGTYTIEARALGYQPHRATIDLSAARESVADMVLTPLVTSIDTMRVRANRAVPLDEFNRRRKTGFGHFLDEDDIKKKAPTYMGDIFRGIPGVVTMPGQFGRDRVLIRSTGMTGDCAPAIFINGLYVNIEDGDLDNIINPKDVRAIELYSRIASIPLQFQTRNGCGSAVIWTGARTDDPPARR
ncbi:carboxypeptidase regulatory-like domain-containing protein [Gemmatimonas sp.]|jgi:hypothetical protein|uniref:carboxypeptidase regulatory-like domain-containing protein n=1 Tax=Gemmatimonas sp. TaxID=1962908 RepID=UPI0037C08B3C